MKSYVLQVVVTQNEDGNYLARVPSLPACVSRGGTREEALANVKATAKQYMETLGIDNYELIDQDVLSQVEVNL